MPLKSSFLHRECWENLGKWFLIWSKMKVWWTPGYGRGSGLIVFFIVSIIERNNKTNFLKSVPTDMACVALYENIDISW